MNTIDASFAAFEKLVSEISCYDDTIFTEQDTRVKVIDRIVVDILGWHYDELSTEEMAGAGHVPSGHHHHQARLQWAMSEVHVVGAWL